VSWLGLYLHVVLVHGTVQVLHDGLHDGFLELGALSLGGSHAVHRDLTRRDGAEMGDRG
jgi:hypothetical protein